MLYKSRAESSEQLILQFLNTRMDLFAKDKQYFFNLKKGYEGEKMFDILTEKLECECYILNDLLFKINNTLFQIDSLIIMSEAIYFFEVKNYEGDYYYESDRLYKIPKSEIINPLHQLRRSESLLRQLLDNLGCNSPINASVVFINPEFTLYQAPQGKPFIFPTQVNRYLQKLQKTFSQLNGKHKMIADKLISLHIKESPYKQLPFFEYNQLQKGITCAGCSSFSILVEGKKCICEECGHEEEIEAAVLRSVNEFKLLFPDRKITTNIIYEWCKVVKSKKRISRILEKNFKIAGTRRWSFYE
ncbi:nuclease-related domain-containing protein [Niallia sp. 01092]|uniref:nuclease-related domain-containing protein n=1 Tax=unclassified Niallia TaxID=2837522 RepID=UPI003FD1D209